MNTSTSKVDLFAPRVEVKKRFKKIIVSGRSRMADPGEFYCKLADDLTNYFNQFNRTLYLEFYFDYINTGSSKWLLYAMQLLDSDLKKKGGVMEIVWKYDNDDETIMETGEVLKSHVSIPFQLKPV